MPYINRSHTEVDALIWLARQAKARRTETVRLSDYPGDVSRPKHPVLLRLVGLGLVERGPSVGAFGLSDKGWKVLDEAGASAAPE